MINFRAKFDRVAALTRLVGFAEALRFEVNWSLRTPEIRLRVPGYPADFTIRRHNPDYFVFASIFLEGELSAYVAPEPRLVIDGGANVGFSTAYLARRYPSATIVAVEPSVENCARIERNCAGLDNVVILRGGLWPRGGLLRIQNPEDESWAFRCEPADEPADGVVPAYTIDEVIERTGADHCDLLKLDIEGAETELFEAGASAWLDRVDAIMVEVHGEQARLNIEARCPAVVFDSSWSGEKLVLLRKSSPCQAGQELQRG
jgi:FkbM family methyltransferase